MMNKRVLIYFLLLFSAGQLAAQPVSHPDALIHFSSSNTAFPDTGRTAGHLYDSVLYDAATHYQDSSVLLLIPPGFKPGKKIDLVFWFHGWRNNIDTALAYYRLADQFLAAEKNAVLVLTETARNAPDSYGGKLEQPHRFAFLVDDVLAALKNKKWIDRKASAGHLILAGHSGAYRVIAHILASGGVKIQEVDLFDALYGETDLFDQWIKTSPDNRFINWYTNVGGGTDEVSIQMMAQLKMEKLSFLAEEEISIDQEKLKNNRIIFVHSKREHNDIIFNPDNFRLLLGSTPFLSSY